jgi:O-antigen/teichoic acid export membrane protein
MILARMLTKADFGLAAVFGMTISMLELAGRMSFGQQIIQAKDGDSEPFVASSHAFQFSLALFGAVVMAGLSYPLACAFKVPHLTWAFALLGIVPLAKSVENLDYYRRQREMEYLPAVLCDFVPQAVVTVAAWPLVVWIGDFRVIVVLMLAKAVLGVVMTHAMAVRSYRWNWQAVYFSRMWRFGWPLLINGALMFAAQQADQMVVGAFLSVGQLALYALVGSVVNMPAFVLSHILSSLTLPLLSKVQSNSLEFHERYRACVTYVGMASVWLIVPLIVGGEHLITLLFGSKYAGAGPLVAALGSACAVRLFRLVPAIAAMAMADTHNHLRSNIWRCVGLPLALFAVLAGGGALSVALAALLGECVAAVASVFRLRRRQGVPLLQTLVPACYAGFFIALGALFASSVLFRVGCLLAIGQLFCILLVSLLVAKLLFPDTVTSLIQCVKAFVVRVFNVRRVCDS